MSTTQTQTIERPLPGKNNEDNSRLACLLAEGLQQQQQQQDGDSEISLPLVNAGTFACYDSTLANLTEGRLGSETENAKIRVKIHPSVFIIETNKEMTIEEISTKSLNALVEKRAREARRFSSLTEQKFPRGGGGCYSRKNERFIEGEINNIKLNMEETASSLERLAGLLPVVINIKDWTMHDEKEIRLDLKGNDGMEELVNISHLNQEEWEMERLSSSIVLKDAYGVFYAHHGILDIVLTTSRFTGKLLQHPVIFRLMDVKVWINTPLQIAFPDTSKNPNAKKILYQHPSLTRLRDLNDMASNSKSVSSIIIPELSKFNSTEFGMHYFTAQCFFGKNTNSLKDLVTRYYQLSFKNKPQPKLYEPTATATAASSSSSTASLTTEQKEKIAQSILSSKGKSLGDVSSTLSKEYDENRKRTKRQKTSTDTNIVPSGAPTSISMKNPVTCFFGPQYTSIMDCISEKTDWIEMHLFLTSLNDAEHNKTLVVDRKSNVSEIHDSGRFLTFGQNNTTAFIPDVDIPTLKLILRDDSGESSAAIIASLIYYNNVNLEGREFSNVSDAVVGLFSGGSAITVGDIAREIASIYNIGRESNCDSILFPGEPILAGRRSYGRQYRWYDPINCVVGLYRSCLETMTRNIMRGQPVKVDETAWMYMHQQVLQVVLLPFFDCVLKSGVWAVKEARQLTDYIVREVLLKYTADPDQHKFLLFKKPVMDLIAKIVTHYAVIHSAADNGGVCLAFPRDPPFIVENDTSLRYYTLTDTPQSILNGDNVAENLKSATSVASSPSSSSRYSSETPIRVVNLPVPTGRFLKMNKDLELFINVPLISSKEQKQQQQQTTATAPFSSETISKSFLNYVPPKSLTRNVTYGQNIAEDGFLGLKNKGELVSYFKVVKNTERDDGIKDMEIGDINNHQDDTGSLSSSSSSFVDGVRTSFSVDGKIEHVSAFLPGTTSQPTNLPVHASKQVKYSVKELGMETVFFEPLLSSAVLYEASKTKSTQHLSPMRIYKECVSPLSTGRIDIFPSKVGTVAGTGFEFIWKVLQYDTGLPTTLERLSPKIPSVPISGEDSKMEVIAESGKGVQNIIAIAADQLRGSNNIVGGGTRRAIQQQQQQQQQETQAVVPVNVPARFEPTFTEIELFLQNKFRNVIATIISRMMMLVSNEEMKIIKEVCEHVSHIMVDGLYVALDPRKAIEEILERITAEQNGITIDTGNGGYGSLRYASSGRLFINDEASEEAAAAIGGGGALGTGRRVPVELRSILDKLNTIGSTTQQQQQQQRQQRQANNNNTVPEDIKVHNEQMQKIRDSSLFTSKLLNYIRDDGRKDRIKTNISETLKKYSRIPSYFIASKAQKPIPWKHTKDNINLNKIPEDLNFSPAQNLFVPVNPRHILTDMQWLNCISIIETATRDSAIVMQSFQEQADKTTTQLEELLSQWNNIVSQVTDEKSPAYVSSVKLEWLNNEASRIAAIRENSEKSKIVMGVQGKIVNIDELGIVAVARSIVDVDFYIKMPNVWASRDWKNLIYYAVNIAATPLINNISRGIMAASQTSVLYDSSLALIAAEQATRNITM
ncbi:capsid protein [White spot syndrome virus]|uniref:Capsid protein n=1 Tax=White spot syndrome virus TaxID=342409 RepID=A0A2U8T4Q5_9VIRU|nr:capsid protein [White spot syndrome virus]